MGLALHFFLASSRLGPLWGGAIAPRPPPWIRPCNGLTTVAEELLTCDNYVRQQLHCIICDRTTYEHTKCMWLNGYAGAAASALAVVTGT